MTDFLTIFQSRNPEIWTLIIPRFGIEKRIWDPGIRDPGIGNPSLYCTLVQAMAESLNEMSREELTDLVRYHIVPSLVTAAELHDERRLTTLSSTDKQLVVKRYHSVSLKSLSS